MEPCYHNNVYIRTPYIYYEYYIEYMVYKMSLSLRTNSFSYTSILRYILLLFKIKKTDGNNLLFINIYF